MSHLHLRMICLANHASVARALARHLHRTALGAVQVSNPEFGIPHCAWCSAGEQSRIRQIALSRRMLLAMTQRKGRMPAKDDLVKKLKDKTARVAILGLGYVGLPLAV